MYSAIYLPLRLQLNNGNSVSQHNTLISNMRIAKIVAGRNLLNRDVYMEPTSMYKYHLVPSELNVKVGFPVSQVLL